MSCGPHLGGHEDVVAPDPGGANAFTDRGLVVIALRGIDMAESDLQCLGDDVGALFAAQLPGATTEHRYERLAHGQHPFALDCSSFPSHDHTTPPAYVKLFAQTYTS